MNKLASLRTLMKEKNIDAYVIYSGDAHGSSYVADYWKSRAWLSGFTGSSGTVVVTETHAGLWTDGRYFVQAEAELSGTEFTLYKMDMLDVPTYKEFLAENLPQGGKLGFDGRVVGVKEFNKIKDALEDKAISYAYGEDLMDKVWKDRPSLPTEPAFEHEPRFACTPASEKLGAVRREMAEHGATSYLVTAMDGIAWLTNIRGRDIAFTPVVYAYAVITTDTAHIFIDRNKVAPFATKLTAQGFTLHDYDEIAGFLGNLPCGTLVYDPGRINVLLSEAVPSNVTVETDLDTDIITMLKAPRTPAELANIRYAFLKEGTVLVRCLKWLKEQKDITELTEGDVVRKLTSLRELEADFVSDGFSTIVAIGGNASQAHYSSGPVGDKLKPEGFLLIDTGAQYLDGTTDTTRTIAVGPLTPEMKRHYTLVLKGYMRLARAVFPKGTAGVQLDVLARAALWAEGLDYRHGTGHGIGYCLAVHEGPQGVHKKGKVAFEPGMMISNEPAFYVDGVYGIRTENIEVVTKKAETEYGEFYGFETLMYCPIDTTAIDASILTQDEIDYLNAYHAKTYEMLAPRLNDDERAWLKEATKAINAVLVFS